MLTGQTMEPLCSLLQETLPLPGAGATADRHRRLFDIGRADLSWARLVEAHWDAVAILAEDGRQPRPDCVYGVWASERRGQELTLKKCGNFFELSGQKAFCSGAGLIDRALVTVSGGEHRLVDVDLRQNAHLIIFDGSEWKTSAFRESRTVTAVFREFPVSYDDFVGEPTGILSVLGSGMANVGPLPAGQGARPVS